MELTTGIGGLLVWIGWRRAGGATVVQLVRRTALALLAALVLGGVALLIRRLRAQLQDAVVERLKVREHDSVSEDADVKGAPGQLVNDDDGQVGDMEEDGPVDQFVGALSAGEKARQDISTRSASNPFLNQWKPLSCSELFAATTPLGKCSEARWMCHQTTTPAAEVPEAPIYQ